VNKIILALGAAAAVLALAACASSSTSHAAPATSSSAAPANSSAPAAPQSTSPADCSAAVQSWLSETGWYTIPTTIQQGITLLADDARAYLADFAPNISQPTGQQAAMTYLNTLGDGPFGSLPAADPIPSCADPANYWQDAMTQDGNATGADAGTPQATGDMQAILSDLSSLRGEVSQNAPGSGFTLPGS
jgi:hypothetical protein